MELNDSVPLNAYNVHGKLLLTLKRFIMALPPKFVLRVMIVPEIAVKLTLTERPHSVEDLIKTLQEKCRPRLDYEFSLHYEDPDFDRQLCCLVDIEDLPEKGTLQVVRSEADNI
ncbi:hypothetical protein WMY93_010166 [Mugilogobius chulae]|uniref:Uncharacterized protein n=1 Tax=Mugilogobius chulae TaxID=88201 RepID=A0AAW0PAB8_9GOBI